MKIPKNLIIEGGRIKTTNGQSLKSYLQTWQAAHGIKDGTLVNLQKRTSVIAHSENCDLARNWAS